jgi:hypothetical protein
MKKILAIFAALLACSCDAIMVCRDARTGKVLGYLASPFERCGEFYYLEEPSEKEKEEYWDKNGYKKTRS